MDTIELQPFRITSRAFFLLLVKLRLRRFGWLYGCFLLIGMFTLITKIDVLLGLLLISFPLIMLGVLYYWAFRKDSRQLLEERRFLLNEHQLEVITSGGARSELPWSYIQYIVEINGHYLLYLSVGQMILIDKVAFPDRSSEERFLFWVKDIKRKRA